MTPEQWTLAERLYHEAAMIAISDRGTWLARACGGDEIVRREVESLLAQDASRTGVLDGHAFDQITPETGRTSLVGRQLGGYEFLSLIDEGGMGQVYRARDLALPRDVAVKVVSPEFTHDPVRRARFRKEAEVLAGFAHPHIAHVYAFGEAEGRFLLAMELVPGETLAERIGRGPLRVTEALDIARQVADALDAAHEQGVIHRDLKPANIRITPDGAVKVLDFGLATSVRPALAAERTTLTQTAPGTLLGTVAYMSPEQARGETVDKRTDIWAFGCVLFEMLTGRRLFGSASTAETLALVMTRDIDWSLLPAQVPMAVRALLRRCLERDPRKRLRDVAAIRFALEDMAGSAEQTATTGDAPSRTRATQVRTIAVITAVAAAVLIVATVIGLALWKSEPSLEPSPSRRASSIIPPQGQRFAGFTSGKPMLAISPNDNYIAYVATTGAEDARQLYLHSTTTDSAEPVPGTVGAHTPFFSPDEEWLGFYSRQDILMKIPVKGGVAPVLVTTDVVNPFGATWTEDHRIVLGSFGSALHVVREEGGVPEVLTRLTPGDIAQRWPFSLPGGKAVLFKVDSGVAAQQIGESNRRSLIAGTSQGSLPQYSPSGHVVHAQAGSLSATPFDLTHLQENGAPTKVMSGVMETWGVAHFSLSASGSLVYIPGEVQPSSSNLVRVSRGGTVERTFGAQRFYNQPRVAPDGRRFVVDVRDEKSRLWQLWLYDLRANELNQFTYKTDGDNRHGTWAGSNQLVVQSDRKKTRQLFLHQVDGGTVPQRLTDFPAMDDRDVYSYPVSFCGDALTFVRLVPIVAEGWVLYMGDSAGRGRQQRLDFPMAGDGAPSLSPDCRWLAYISDESGEREVWVRPFPPNLGKGQQISKGGGNEPVWNSDRNKREIFYRNGQSMMAARISDQGFLEGKAATLFRDSYLPGFFVAYSRPNYDVFPDGSFLMLKPVEQEQPVTQIKLVLNWSEELKRLVPTKK